MLINQTFKLLFLSLILVSCSSKNSFNVSSNEEKTLVTMSYINPVLTTKSFPDPSILRDDDGRYWTFATEGDYAVSEDLVNWEYMGNILMTAGSPNWATNGAHLWAPDIQKINDKYICYYSMSTWGDPNPGIGYAYCENLDEGYWTDGGKLFLSSEIGVNNSIDPMVYKEGEYVYMYFGSFNGIYVIELEEDGMGLLDNSIDYARVTKKFITWPYEGSYLVKRNDYYYLYLSRGSCCNSLGSTYNVVVYRGESPVGPFYNHKGELAENGEGYLVIQSNQEFIGPGHNAVTNDDEGNDYLIYHSYSQKYPSKRMLCIDKLIYDEDGWPYVDTFSPSYTKVEDGPKVYITAK